MTGARRGCGREGSDHRAAYAGEHTPREAAVQRGGREGGCRTFEGTNGGPERGGGEEGRTTEVRSGRYEGEMVEKPKAARTPNVSWGGVELGNGYASKAWTGPAGWEGGEECGTPEGCAAGNWPPVGGGGVRERTHGTKLAVPP